MSFDYSTCNLEALISNPILLETAELPSDMREALEKSKALKQAMLDWIANGKIKNVLVNGVKYKLVKI